MKKITGLMLALLLPLLSHGQTVYNQFGPATGILKGSTSTPITTAATAADIVALWASCSANEYLNQSGTCDLISLTASVTGTLPVANGGTNLTGATDDHAMVGNGTTWQSKALTDCNASDSAVTYDTATNVWGCNTISGGGTGANPTGTVGLSAVNGSALTFLRSDGAPALSQSIAPTWSAAHTYSLALSGTTGPLILSSATPGMQWVETDGAANTQRMRFYQAGGVYHAGFADDTGATTDFLAATRSTAAVSNVAIGNATDNPTVSFLGTGAITAGGILGIADGDCSTTWGLYLASDTDTGLCRAASNALGIYAGGASVAIARLISGNPQFTFADGSAAAPVQTFGNDLDTGRARLGANQFCDSTGGTCRVTVGPGVQVGAPTGGDQGAGTVNATGLYINGVAVGTLSTGNIVRKTSSTARTSTTPSADPHLTAAVVAGTYAVQGFLHVTGLNNGNGLKVGVFRSGVAECSIGITYPNASNAVLRVFMASSSVSLSSITTASSDFVEFRGNCIATTSGNVELYWSADSSGSGTALAAGSWMWVTRAP